MGSVTTSKMILPRRVIKQPVPHFAEQGDCGPCVLGGVLGYEGATGHINDKCSSAVGKVLVTYCSSEPASLSFHTMTDALHEAQRNGSIEDFICESPIWPAHEAQNQFGPAGHMVSLQWYAYIKMAIRAGYYGLAMVNHKGRGTDAWSTDHWVLICGFRTRLVPIPHLKNHPTMSNSKKYVNEIFISNSSNRSKDERWIEVNKFLMKYGGYNAILVLPAKEDK